MEKIEEAKDADVPDLESQHKHSHQPPPEDHNTNDRTPEANNGGQKGKDSATDEPQYMTGYRLVALNIATTTVAFLMLLDSSIISSAIPRLTSDFHSLLDVGWYGAAYQLANASFQPLAGTIYTHLNIKWTFVVFFAVFELGSLLSGVAVSSKMLIVGRAVEGLGASGLQNGAFVIMSTCISREKRPALVGLGMGIAQIGMVLGPVIGGVLTQYATWRWCFYINLPIGAVAMLMFIPLSIPEQIAKKSGVQALKGLMQKLDIPGFIFFAGSAIQLLLALQYGGNQYAWNSSVVIGLLCGAGGTLIVFVFLEHKKGKGAIIPLELIRKRFVWCGCLVMFFAIPTSFCASYYLPIYFQAIKQASPSLSGVYLLPIIISQIIFVVLSGSILGKTGYHLPFCVAAGVLMAIGGGLISTYDPATPTGRWIGYEIILGAGRGLGMQMPIVAVQGLLPPAEIAIGTSFIMLGHTFGGAISLSVAQTIFSNSLRSGLRHYAPSTNIEEVITAGATAIWSVVPEDKLAGVLKAYSSSVDHVFYYTAAAAVCSFFFSWGLGWKDIRKKPLQDAAQKDPQLSAPAQKAPQRN